MLTTNSINLDSFNFYYYPKKKLLKALFLDRFYMIFDNEDLAYIEFIKIDKNNNHTLYFKSPHHKFFTLLDRKFRQLRTISTNREAIYLHQNLNIPLIGLNYIGIIDRNTNIIEVKPITGCILNCIFCSVGEGRSKKFRDFVVEPEFLVNQTEKLIHYKKDDHIEIHINPHGEPLLYKPLTELIKQLKENKKIKIISMNTNAVLLDKRKIDQLMDAGLTRFNISLNAINKEKLKILSGDIDIDSKKIIDLFYYIINKYGNKALLIAPVIVPTYNEDEIEPLIKLCKELNITCGIQKFLIYPRGKKPVKEKPWDKFYTTLRELEKKYNIPLILDHFRDFAIHRTRKLIKPFRKGNIIKTKIISKGRYPYNYIGYAEIKDDFFNGRLVEIVNHKQKRILVGDIIKARIIRDKHNIFFADLI